MSWDDYRNSLDRAIHAGNATEHTHRPALKSVLESLERGIVATNEPTREECGAPDFLVTRGQIPVGFIETKRIGESLDKVASSEQMSRYLAGLNNLVLTDYLEFRWYLSGRPCAAARLGTVHAGRLRPFTEEARQETENLLRGFLAADAPVVKRAEDLVTRMAAIARLIRDATDHALRQDPEPKEEDRNRALREQYAAFKSVLLHNLDPAKFADMYAQTLSYGLFAARCQENTPKVTREHAAYALPRTNPFLRHVFDNFAGVNLDERLAWAVDDLASLLNRADMTTVLKQFGQGTGREDPIFHFYETFLAAYDPTQRKHLGVYYTPEQVVSYIVRSVDELLKARFDLDDGLADSSKIRVRALEPAGGFRQVGKRMVKDTRVTKAVHKVLILDPAVGTGTFLHGVVQQIFESFRSNAGLWSGYVPAHLLPRLLGFEILMAPYAVAHMKLRLQLANMGYPLHATERLQVYLADTLEEAHRPEETEHVLMTQWLAAEARSASKVKGEYPVMVVLGNPPYSIQSQNLSAQARRLVEPYHYVDGKRIKERAALQMERNIQDDYVKFLRFAQNRVERTGYGIVAYVCNHAYLDNTTLRGVRWSLLTTFDEIYVLDLHGNEKKKSETHADDKGVFDIEQGVAIGVFVKYGDPKKGRVARVRHADLWGSRAKKFEWLSKHDVATTKWTTVAPKDPDYLFIHQNTELLAEYETGLAIDEAMPQRSNGIVTACDALAVDFDVEPLLERAKTFRSEGLSDPELREALRFPNKKGWDLSQRRASLRKEHDLRALIRAVLYRPFDVRYVLYHKSFVWGMAYPTMRHLLAGDNLALITSRFTKGEAFRHIQVSRHISEAICMSSKTSNNGFSFPLYLYVSVRRSGHRERANRIAG